jgi:hypothetical protein
VEKYILEMDNTMYPAQYMMLVPVVLSLIIEFLHNLVVSYNYQGLPDYFSTSSQYTFPYYYCLFFIYFCFNYSIA